VARRPPRQDGAEVKERIGQLILRTLRPPGDGRRDERGRCSVCGAETTFAYNSWIVPRELAVEWRGFGADLARRESLWCDSCAASLRVRRIAEVLLGHYAETASSLAQLVEEAPFRGLDVAEINGIGAAHAALAPHPSLRYSEYPEEDLQALSYPDASFDLVLTSETLEHVPDPVAALAETRRVLRPGGRHVFTIPVPPGRATTRSRAGLPPQYHGRASGLLRLLSSSRDDMLAHTDFGTDVAETLRELGFEPEIHFEGSAEMVFCATAA